MCPSPITIGDERLGGVRIGYSMATAARAEERALRRPARSGFDDVDRRSLNWLLLAVLLDSAHWR